jgi:pimeloyl-ACP methyl ester carboxylesterase
MPEISGIEHRYVDAGGLRTHLVEAGQGDPVVLLHGWPQNWYMWRALIPPLAHDYRVIAPDLRGLGWTDAPRGGYDKEGLATDVLRLLDALELDRVRVVGHDWGAWVGFLLALRRPERVERLVAIAAPPPWAIRPSFRGIRQLPRTGYQIPLAAPRLGGKWLVERPGFVKRFIRTGARDKDAWTGTEMNAFVQPLQEPERARASVLYYRTWLTREFFRVLAGRYRSGRLSTPTLVLVGQKDRVVTPAIVGTDHTRYADDLRVEVIEGSGHFVPEEAPDAVLEQTLDFLAAGGPAASGAKAGRPEQAQADSA